MATHRECISRVGPASGERHLGGRLHIDFSGEPFTALSQSDLGAPRASIAARSSICSSSMIEKRKKLKKNAGEETCQRTSKYNLNNTKRRRRCRHARTLQFNKAFWRLSLLAGGACPHATWRGARILRDDALFALVLAGSWTSR